MRRIIILFIISLLVALISQNSFAEYLSIDTFDDETMSTNNLGGDCGCWIFRWDDPAQSCNIYYDQNEKIGEWGASLKLVYDVDSKKKAACGFYSLFKEVDLRPYDRLIFYVKGDKKKGFTRRFQVEIATTRWNQRVAVEGVTDKWQRIVIPLSEFKVIKDWSRVTKFAVVIEDNVVTDKTGVLYFDDIYFSDSERAM